jgi:hypothetical protein
MKRRWIIAIAVVAMLVGGAAVASAEFRMDIDVPWWLYLGLSQDLEDQLEVDLDLTDIDISSFAVVVPNIQAYWMFDGGLLKLGVGARIYTLLIMNFLYPSVVGEIQLGRFDVNLNVGGGVGVLFGLGPTFEWATGPWMTMDLSAGYRVTDWFRVGVGAFAIAQTEYPTYFPYAVYVSGKFIVNPGRKNRAE